MTDQQQSSGIPPGWDYNPSTWWRRLPTLVLALIGCGVASYLALFQLGVFSTVWEPFFRDGSRGILLGSSIAHLLPIPDAAVGAAGYATEAVLDLIGGDARWRTRPCAAIAFTLLACCFWTGSILLSIFQPVLFGAWCTLCLASASISILILGPAIDELLASLQHLKRQRASGRSVWRAFWGLDPEPADGHAQPATG
jgi:hypothetical protein